MTNIEKIEILKDEANKNPATLGALMMFNKRKRPRASLTLAGLEYRMQLEGYKYSQKDYEPVIHLLARLSLGSLDFNTQGNLKGLKNINVVLKSIAEAVFGKATDFVPFSPRPRPRPTLHKAKPKPPKLDWVKSETISKGLVVAKTEMLVLQVDLDIIINGKHVRIPVPKDLTNEDIATLIGRFKGA